MDFRATNVLLMSFAYPLRRLLAVLALAVLPVFAASGTRLPLQGVEVDFAEKPAELSQVIDGKDTGRAGWSVFPRTGEAHALIVAPRCKPVRAQAFDVTLCFLSGMPRDAISATSPSPTRSIPCLSSTETGTAHSRCASPAPGLPWRLEKDGRLVAARRTA